jgi:hypothetical protein
MKQLFINRQSSTERLDRRLIWSIVGRSLEGTPFLALTLAGDDGSNSGLPGAPGSSEQLGEACISDPEYILLGTH